MASPSAPPDRSAKTTARSLPETYGTIALALGGWGGLFLVLGLRPIVWAGGAIASLVTVAWWLGEVARLPVKPASADLLELAVVEARLAAIAPLVGRSTPAQKQWEKIVATTLAVRAAAAEISDRNPLLIPDLYETILTALGLAERAAKASAALETVETVAYRDQARLQRDQAIAGLQAARTSLCELRDGLLLGELAATGTESTLPDRLSLIVETNRRILQSSTEL